jgi:D-alanine transaminase
MPRVVYVNGRYEPYRQARVHVEDRGFQFADAVYEVIEVQGKRLVDEERHLDRLERSLGEIGFGLPMSRPALAHVIRETIRRNGVTAGIVYLQVTRGVAPRDFLIPSPAPKPTVVCIARQLDQAKLEQTALQGIAVKTMPEMRWARCDVKTVMLLPAVLAKDRARKEGAREVWFVDRDGFVTEGGSSNAWIVTKQGAIVTRQLSVDLLPGVTRAGVLDMIRSLGMRLEERPFRVPEALAADEAFNTAASATVMPVVEIDGTKVGSGRPGPVALRLRREFHDHVALSVC